MGKPMKWSEIVRNNRGGRMGAQPFVTRGPLSFVMKLTQGGVDVGTNPAPGVETTALVHVANASKIGITPTGVNLTMRLAPTWGSPATTIAVADKAITVPAAASSDVSFIFTFPAASAGGAGSVVCTAVSPAGAIIATLSLTVLMSNPITYAASGLVSVFDTTTLVPAGQSIMAGRSYLAIWSVTNLSKYLFTTLAAPANLYVWMWVTYLKADGSQFSVVDLYPNQALSFTFGESKTQGIPVPSFTPPADVNGGKAQVVLLVRKPPGISFEDILLSKQQENPVGIITYEINLTW